eukprot:7973449-Alexandrium_andersonii.AAC.1
MMLWSAATMGKGKTSGRVLGVRAVCILQACTRARCEQCGSLTIGGRACAPRPSTLHFEPRPSATWQGGANILLSFATCVAIELHT